MSNSVDPDETAYYELSHLDLCCLQKPILSLMAVKELKESSLGKEIRKRLDRMAKLYRELFLAEQQLQQVEEGEINP